MLRPVFPAVNDLFRLRLWIGWLLLLAVRPVPASVDATWFTRAWKTDDGLLNNNVQAIVQTQDNYLWVVPSVGLMRFDGVAFSRFPVEDLTGPIDNHICTALRGRGGVLWFATYGGQVFGLRPNLPAVTLPTAGLPESTPLTLAEDHAGALWLGYVKAIIQVKEKRVTRFTATEGVPAGDFHSLISDGAGNIWLAKGDRLCVFQEGQFRQVLSARDIRSLGAARTNAIWFVAGTNLFSCNTGGVLQDYGALASLATATRRALLEDHTGAIWIGTVDDGLLRYDASGFQKVETFHLPIMGLTEDTEGNLWVSTDGAGLERISLTGVQKEVAEDGLSLEEVRSVCEDGEGKLWGATQAGELVVRLQGRWRTAAAGAPFNETVRCVAPDPQGGIWVGTREDKLWRLFNGNCVFCGQGKPRSPINALLPAATGGLWILAGEQLQRWNGQIETVSLSRKVDRFSAITEDAQGNVWVGARGLVMRFKGTNFVDETPALPVANRTVCCLYGTPEGSMWISCGGVGLLRLKDGHVSQIGLEQGLPNDYIAQIVADGRGWLWFGCDHGIFKVRQPELARAMDDHSVRLRPIVYGRNEGLLSLEALFSTAGPFVLPRAFCSHDGKVWLLTHTAIVTADPTVLPENYPAPQVLLTRVARDGQVIARYGTAAPIQIRADDSAAAAPLSLPPGFRHLEFDFTGFHFTAPENLHFRYQLVGFDTDWIEAAERHADYSRLTWGNYQFRVAAGVGDGPWSEQPAVLAFTVAPFFWQTWWFRLGALVLFTSAVIAVVRYISFRRLQARMRLVEQRAALDRERTRIARDLHDDLGGSLNMVALTLDMTQREPGIGGSLNGKIGHCSTIVRQVGRSVDEIVWAINPRNDTLRYMVDYISQFAVEFLHAAELPCRMSLPDAFPEQMISPEARHNLLLVVKEALNNVIRHAQASEVWVRITTTENQVAMVIEDNGRGFERPPDRASCDGLNNMRERMNEIGGQFQLSSHPGKGTRVTFLYSWPAPGGR